MEENKVLEKIKTKKGANILVKMLSVLLIPMITIVVMAALALEAVGSGAAEVMVEHELKALAYAMEMNIDNAAEGALAYENGNLYKGALNLSENVQFLDGFTTQTDVEICLFWGSKSVASGIVDAAGNRVTDIAVDNDISTKVLAGEGTFISAVYIGDSEYYAYYAPLYNSDSATPVGMIMTAIPSLQVNAAYDRLLTSNIIFMVILVAVFTLLTVLVVLFLVKAIMKVVGNLHRVAEGELNFNVSEKLLSRSDEVGKIARAVHSVITEFSAILNNIYVSMKELNHFSGQFKDNLDTIGSSIANADSAVEEIANGATAQVSDTQNLETSLNHMSQAIGRTVENVEILSTSASQMKENNEIAGGTLNELIDISVRTQKSVDEVQNQTNITNQSAQDIRSATDMIAGIASQTNLLSLNASIEAARAGEMGKGFAVVAEEIRELADQSKGSADQIRKIVEILIGNSNHSVEIMNGVVEEIYHQNEKLEITQQAFESLNQEVMKVVSAIELISTEIDKIDTSKVEVLNGIELLSEIAQENAASTEETSASMTELRQVVEECRGATGRLVEIADELTENANKFKI